MSNVAAPADSRAKRSGPPGRFAGGSRGWLWMVLALAMVCLGASGPSTPHTHRNDAPAARAAGESAGDQASSPEPGSSPDESADPAPSPQPQPPSRSELKAIDELPVQALKGATSPYQRASLASPVRWQPFDDHSFALARKLNRPVLLDIGANWCHWCHVMDEETYSNPQVAQLINEQFVPIRVDRDRRPDVDHYYQNAAADFDGAGGWPLTCFTLPDGALFAAWGYLPPVP